MKRTTLTRRPPVLLTAAAGEPKVAARQLTRAAWVIGGVALLLVVAFDLGPPLAFNDDWGFAWDVRHFNPLHIHMYPSDSALALVQVPLAWLVTLGHADQRLLRISEVVFIGLTMYSTHRLSRRLGADATWSAIAAIALLAFPVFTADATTFMTDVPYVGLLSAAVLGAVRWRDGPRWIALCVVFATLATLQRQVGATTPLAVTFALLLFRRKGLRGRDWVGVGLLWVSCVAAIAVPAITGITPPTQGNRLQAALTPVPVYVLASFMFLPGLVGLGLLPFLPGLALGGEEPRARDRSGLFVFALILIELAVFVVAMGDIFPGNVFQPRGFILTTLVPSLKPQLFPTPLFLGLEVGSVATVALLIRRWRCLTPAQLGWPGAVLLIVAGLQFLPLTLLHYVPYDRYYLPIVAMLVPLAARAASGTSALVVAGRLSLGVVAAMIVLYCVGEHEVPWYDSTGRIIGGTGIPGARDFSADGPNAPRLVLEYANPDDPRQGYSWSSLAPGKIIIRVP